MELSRRDALAAIAAMGAGGAAATYLQGHSAGPGSPDASDGDAADDADLPDDQQVLDVMVAIAEVVYPTAVEGIEPFVETVLAGRLERPDHGRHLRATVGKLDDLAVEWHGDRVSELDVGTRDQLLREVGADTADEAPDGSTSQRVRYYVVNELLLALYASPTGGELVGIENPQGHAGGTDSYQHGPGMMGEQ